MIAPAPKSNSGTASTLQTAGTSQPMTELRQRVTRTYSRRVVHWPEAAFEEVRRIGPVGKWMPYP
jgi:hypothetical protein